MANKRERHLGRVLGSIRRTRGAGEAGDGGMRRRGLVGEAGGVNGWFKG